MKNSCKSDGALISWGQVDKGGKDGTELREDLKGDVAEIFSTENAFAVIRASDGSLVTWGDDVLGGDSADVADQLKANIQELHCSLVTSASSQLPRRKVDSSAGDTVSGIVILWKPTNVW